MGDFWKSGISQKGWHHHPSKPSLSSPNALPVLHDAFPSWFWEDKALLVALDYRDFRCTEQLSIQLLQYLLLTFEVQQNFHAMTDILWKALALLPHLESDLRDCHELSSGSLAMPHVPIQKVVMTLLPCLLHHLSNQIAIADGSERLLDPPNIQWQIKQVLCPSSIYFYSLFKLYDNATCNLLKSTSILKSIFLTQELILPKDCFNSENIGNPATSPHGPRAPPRLAHALERLLKETWWESYGSLN